MIEDKDLLSEPFVKEAKSIAPLAFGITVGIISVLTVLFFIHLLSIDKEIEIADCIQMLALVIITSTLFFSIYVHWQKIAFDESEVYLNKSIDLINKAYETLKTKNGTITNKRISWVTSARLLRRAMNLSVKIQTTSHKEMFLSEHDYQRHKFNDLLKLNGKPLPTEFFMGENYTLGDIGKSAIDSVANKSFDWIPEVIIAEVYRFMSYPEGYDDPLEETKQFSHQELDRIWLLDNKGLYDYLVFRKYYLQISDKVYSRGTATTKPKVVTEHEINTTMSSVSGIEIGLLDA